jgi:hypothetical protein
MEMDNVSGYAQLRRVMEKFDLVVRAVKEGGLSEQRISEWTDSGVIRCQVSTRSPSDTLEWRLFPATGRRSVFSFRVTFTAPRLTGIGEGGRIKFDYNPRNDSWEGEIRGSWSQCSPKGKEIFNGVCSSDLTHESVVAFVRQIAEFMANQ